MTFEGYIPLSLIPKGGPIIYIYIYIYLSPSLLSPERGDCGQREGDPERINRNSLGVMVGPGPLGDAIVLLLLLLCFRGLSCHHRQVGFDEQDIRRKT